MTGSIHGMGKEERGLGIEYKASESYVTRNQKQRNTKDIKQGIAFFLQWGIWQQMISMRKIDQGGVQRSGSTYV
jgi:hypothetical protein